MSTLVVSCKSCAAPLGSYEVADHGLLSAILLAKHHASGNHTGGHQLEVSIAGVPIRTDASGSDSALPPQNVQAGPVNPPPGQPSSATAVASTSEAVAFLAAFQSLAVVEVECQQEGCTGRGVRRRWSVPRWFAGSVPILHHTTHEGHAFRIWLDGVEVVPSESGNGLGGSGGPGNAGNGEVR